MDKSLDMMVLEESLRLAVPWWVKVTAGWSAEQRGRAVRDDAVVVGSLGDALMFGGKRWEPAARAFNALARGLALGAYQPGGSTYAGQHWCVQVHDGCPNAGRFEAAPDVVVDAADVWEQFHAHLDDLEALIGPDGAGGGGFPLVVQDGHRVRDVETWDVLDGLDTP